MVVGAQQPFSDWHTHLTKSDHTYFGHCNLPFSDVAQMMCLLIRSDTRSTNFPVRLGPQHSLVPGS